MSLSFGAVDGADIVVWSSVVPSVVTAMRPLICRRCAFSDGRAAIRSEGSGRSVRTLLLWCGRIVVWDRRVRVWESCVMEGWVSSSALGAGVRLIGSDRAAIVPRIFPAPPNCAVCVEHGVAIHAPGVVPV